MARDDKAQLLRDFITRAQEQLEDMQVKGKDVMEEVGERKEDVEDFVRENPLLALGGAFAVGWVLGRLLKRNKKNKRRR